MKLKKLYNRMRRKSNEDIARENGVVVGQDCRILANPYKCFGSEPYLVRLGNHVEIASGCQFITHDGAVWVLRAFPEYSKIDKFGNINVGNNVFVGINSIILPGVNIGDNCVIGAGSLVTKDIPTGEVWGGVPARFISTISEYKDKVLLNADYTKGMNPKDKEAAIRKAHPEWFNLEEKI